MYTEVYIPEYRQYIQMLITNQYRILNKQEQDDIKYADDYLTFSWWKKLWVSKPGECEESWHVQYYAKKWIKEYKQTLDRLDYEELKLDMAHTQVNQDSHFFVWIKENR